MTRAENPPAYLERLRDEFAMAALQGLLSRASVFGSAKEFADMAFEHADSMLAARQGGGQ